MKKNRGFSLIELLVYLLLSGILLAIISSAFHALNKPYKNINKKFADEWKLNSLDDKIRTSIYKNTLNGFLPIHRWHSPLASPQYITARINKLAANSKPNANSVILELVDTEPSLFLRSAVEAYRFQGSISRSALMGGSIRAWISQEPLGSYLIVAKPKIIFLNGDITEIELLRGEFARAINILTDTKSSSESMPAMLIPIRDHYMLFTSTTNVLRRVSLISSENQPILEGVILEGHPPSSCFVRLESSDKTRQISCENNQTNFLMRLYAIDH